MTPRAPSTRRLHIWGDTLVAQATPLTRFTMPACMPVVSHVQKVATCHLLISEKEAVRCAERCIMHAVPETWAVKMI